MTATNSKGFSLMEVMVVVGLSVGLFLLISTVIMTSFRADQASRVTDSSSTTWYYARNWIAQSLPQIKSGQFDPQSTYVLSDRPTLASGLVVPTEGLLVQTAGGGDSPLDGFYTKPSGDTQLFKDSFTLSITRSQNNYTSQTILASRCMPNQASRQSASGSTIDSSSPKSSGLYVLFADDLKRPFIFSQTNGKLSVRCCNKDGSNCATDNFVDWLPRLFAIQTERGVISSVQEIPTVGEINETWGLGMGLYFDSKLKNTYKLLLFSIENTCLILPKSSQSGQCLRLEVKKISQAADYQTQYQEYNKNWLQVRFNSWSGSFQQSMDTSGMMRF